MARHIRAFAREVRTSRNARVKEVETRRIAEAAPRIERVQVYAVVEDDRQHFTDAPFRS